MVEKKQIDIYFWASVATIISIFFALFVFLSDRCHKENLDKQEYINQLESLNFELQKNNYIIIDFFEKDKQAFLNGEKMGYYRYSTSVINGLIGDGKIRDSDLLRNLDAIADSQNQVNRVLDIIDLMAHTSQINSNEEREMFLRRIKSSYEIVIYLNNQIKEYLPKVIDDLKIHIDNTSIGGTSWFCIN